MTAESPHPALSQLSRRRLVFFGLGSLGLLMIVGIASNAEQFELGETRGPAPRDVLPIERDLGETIDQTALNSEPVELPDSVVIGVAIVLGIGLLYLLSKQRISLRFRRPSIKLSRHAGVDITEEEQAESIAEFARDLIDELNEGDSPRYAIQRAYAAVETGFGAPELTRKAAETPLRYLDRIFGRHQSVQAPLTELTDLFQRARFSREPVDDSMRSDAVAALTEIRDYYQAFAWKKINNSRSKVTA